MGNKQIQKITDSRSSSLQPTSLHFPNNLKLFQNGRTGGFFNLRKKKNNKIPAKANYITIVIGKLSLLLSVQLFKKLKSFKIHLR